MTLTAQEQHFADQIAGLLERVNRIERSLGARSDAKPGTGTCICEWPPEKMRAQSVQMNESFELNKGSMSLDHRCSRHGERAQPNLWGRHKELKLAVTAKEWLSLGVEFPTDQTK